MNLELKRITKFCEKLQSKEVPIDKKLLILEIFLNNEVTIDQISQTGVGKIVNKLGKTEGPIGKLAHKVIKKWRSLINLVCEDKRLKDKTTDNSEKSTKSTFIEPKAKLHKHKTVHELKTDHNKAQNVVRRHTERKLHKVSDLVHDDYKKPEEFQLQSFEEILNENQSRKRKNEAIDNNSNKKFKVMDELKLKPDHLMELPIIDDSSLSKSLPKRISEEPVKPKTDDMDITSRYESQKQRWIPKSKDNGINIPKRPETYINNKAESEIAQYNWKQLKAFESDNKSIIKQTGKYWEKLFTNNHKTAQKLNGETYRDAYFRVERENEKKFLALTSQLTKKAALERNSQKQTKLITVPCLNATRKRRR